MITAIQSNRPRTGVILWLDIHILIPMGTLILLFTNWTAVAARYGSNTTEVRMLTVPGLYSRPQTGAMWLEVIQGLLHMETMILPSIN